MSFRRKWQKTDIKSALQKAKRGAVTIRDAVVISTKFPRAVFVRENEKVCKNLASRMHRKEKIFLAVCRLRGCP